MFGRYAWGRVPFAGSDMSTVVPPGQQQPPGVPEGASWTYQVDVGAAPYGFRSYAGAVPRAAYPGGGVVVTPDPELGIMRVQAWWPDAGALQLVRLDGDGVRTPVRGGYPVTVTTATRRNWATNPSAETDVSGYTAVAGSPTFSRIARAGASSGAWAWRASLPAAATCTIGIPHSLPVASTITVAFDLRLSAMPSGVNLTLAWTTATGTVLTSSTATLTSDQYGASVGQYTRHRVTFAAPNGAAVVGALRLTCTGLPSAATIDGDLVVAERGATDGTFFDGNTFGATWTGTTHLSASVLAPIVSVLDGECPLDVPVTYEVYNPSLIGGRMKGTPTVLPSLGRTWLTHPSRSSAPFVVDLRQTPAQELGVDQGVFYALDSPLATVVSAASRRAPTGSIGFNAISVAERDRLRAEFADLQPVLLRTPAEVFYDDQWIALGALTVDPEGRKAWQDAWLLSAPFFEVAAPDPVLAA